MPAATSQHAPREIQINPLMTRLRGMQSLRTKSPDKDRRMCLTEGRKALARTCFDKRARTALNRFPRERARSSLHQAAQPLRIATGRLGAAARLFSVLHELCHLLVMTQLFPRQAATSSLSSSRSSAYANIKCERCRGRFLFTVGMVEQQELRHFAQRLRRSRRPEVAARSNNG